MAAHYEQNSPQTMAATSDQISNDHVINLSWCFILAIVSAASSTPVTVVEPGIPAPE